MRPLQVRATHASLGNAGLSESTWSVPPPQFQEVKQGITEEMISKLRSEQHGKR